MDPAEYHKMAAVEDEMWFYHALHQRIRRRLADHLPAGPARILDAGCGTGGLMRRLQPLNPEWRWTGVDIASEACNLARQRTTAEVIEGALENLPFAAGHFDAVVSADVLYHIEDDRAALSELARVLRPGGWLIVNVPAYPWLWSYHDEAVAGQRRYGAWELRDKLRRAGLVDIALTHWNLILLPLIVARRKLGPRPAGGSDVQAYPGWVNAGLKSLLALEQALAEAFGRLPAGSSILAVARKPV